MTSLLLVCLTLGLANPVSLVVVAYYCTKAYRARRFGRRLWYLNRAAAVAVAGFILASCTAIAAKYVFKGQESVLIDANSCSRNEYAMTQKPTVDQLDDRTYSNTMPKSEASSLSRTISTAVTNVHKVTIAPAIYARERKIEHMLQNTWQGETGKQRPINATCAAYITKGVERVICFPP